MSARGLAFLLLLAVLMVLAVTGALDDLLARAR